MQKPLAVFRRGGLRVGRATVVAGLLVGLTGALVLFGWARDVEPLKRIFPTLVAMNPVTAIGFLLLSFALPGAQLRGLRLLRRAAGLAAVAVAMLGVLRLGNAFLGWPLAVDQWLFSGKLATDLTGQPNRMAPNTALNFLLVGCALLTFNSRSRAGQLASQICTFLSFVASLLPVVGYTYGARMLTGVGHFIPMSLPTALCFMTVCTGILFAGPGRSLTVPLHDPGVAGIMMRRLLPTVICLPVAIGWLRLQGQKWGLYENELGVALTATAHILMLAAIVWGTSFKLLRFDRRQQEAEAQLKELALTDELTGLRNRRGFFLLAEQEVKLAQHARLDLGLWLIYADLDGLKEINDRLGHAAGSRAIAQAAEVLKETFRETDILARLGGDEFGVLAVSDDPDGGRILVDRLLANLQAFNAREALEYRLSLSAGFVSLDAAVASIEDALQKADLAMYEQKRASNSSRRTLLDDDRRLRALRETDLLDTPSRESLDRHVRIARAALDVPISLVSLVDVRRQFFTSAAGLPEPLASSRETPLSHSFCRHVVEGAQPLIVEDARQHHRLRDNPAVSELPVIAYAGMPVGVEGHVLGSLCAIDYRPRIWQAHEIEILADLAAAVTEELELILRANRAERSERQIALLRSS